MSSDISIYVSIPRGGVLLLDPSSNTTTHQHHRTAPSVSTLAEGSASAAASTSRFSPESPCERGCRCSIATRARCRPPTETKGGTGTGTVTGVGGGGGCVQDQQKKKKMYGTWVGRSRLTSKGILIDPLSDTGRDYFDAFACMAEY